jgi:hypothetical protein
MEKLHVAVQMRLWSHVEDGELHDQKSPNFSQYLRTTGRSSDSAWRKTTPHANRIQTSPKSSLLHT